jgi:hypothetical protein
VKKAALLILGLSFVFSACSLKKSKEDYILSFKHFVQNTEAQCESYSEEDWLKSDKRFNRYLKALESRYRKKLTEEEQLVVAVYRLRYDAVRYGGEVKSGLGEYIDNGLKEDVDFLIKQGSKIKDVISESLKENLED